MLSYDLRNNGHNYIPLYEAIKTNFPEWKHATENTWFIKTDKTANDILYIIKDKFSTEPFADMFVVAEVNPENMNGLIGNSVWDWVKEK